MTLLFFFSFNIILSRIIVIIITAFLCLEKQGLSPLLYNLVMRRSLLDRGMIQELNKLMSELLGENWGRSRSFVVWGRLKEPNKKRKEG